MRIRRRFPPPLPPLQSDPQLITYPAVPAVQQLIHHTPILQPSSAVDETSGHSPAIGTQLPGWVVSAYNSSQLKMEKKDLDVAKEEDEKISTGSNDSHKGSMSSAHQEKGNCIDGQANKSRNNYDDLEDDDNGIMSNNKKMRKEMAEGSRCSRKNGRGWRCCQQTLVGYSLCEHHLGKGRLRRMRESSSTNGATMNKNNKENKKSVMKVGTVKARSISSLLRQTDNLVDRPHKISRK